MSTLKDFTGRTVKRAYTFENEVVNVTLVDNEIGLLYRDDYPDNVVELFECSATVSNSVFLFDNPKHAFDFGILCLFMKSFDRGNAQLVEQHIRNTRR